MLISGVMDRTLVDILICPACLPGEQGLDARVEKVEGEEVLRGALHCSRCGREYLIREGIACLLPDFGDAPAGCSGKYETRPVLGSYLWGHYCDQWRGEEGNAYTAWAETIRPDPGMALDVGCAVGRFTFELARRCGFAVGVDRSRAFIRAARTLRSEGGLEALLVKEGRLMERRNIRIPDSWPRERVEFLVADAQALPFRSAVFSTGASLNLLDKLPRPLHHLKEMNRVCAGTDAQLLVSDPFSWSEEAAPVEHWLGGKHRGPYAGDGFANLKRILEGGEGALAPPWRVTATGSVWWKLRNHRNHYECIRSWFAYAIR